MEWRGTAPSMQEPSFLGDVLRNRRKAHSKTSSTATRRGTIDSRDAMASGHVIVRTYMPIGHR